MSLSLKSFSYRAPTGEPTGPPPTDGALTDNAGIFLTDNAGTYLVETV